MIIQIDICPDRKTFFISVPLSEKEAISFDYTQKGHRMIKQVLIEEKEQSKEAIITAEWDTIEIDIDSQKLLGVKHVKWIDLNNKRDWCNNQIWETIWRKPITKELEDKLLYYSDLIQDNYRNLPKISYELENFSKLIQKTINNVEGGTINGPRPTCSARFHSSNPEFSSTL